MADGDATRRAAGLARRLAAGDENAFAELYDLLGSRLYAVARSLSRRPADAEDVVQDTFLALVRSRSHMAEVRDLEAYIFAALRRTAIRRAQWIARREATSTEELTESTPEAPSEVRLPDDERLEIIERLRRRLPEDQRDVLALKIEGEMTFAEIGSVLDVSANTAASRYRYALEKLRAALARTGSKEP